MNHQSSEGGRRGLKNANRTPGSPFTGALGTESMSSPGNEWGFSLMANIKDKLSAVAGSVLAVGRLSVGGTCELIPGLCSQSN